MTVPSNHLYTVGNINKSVTSGTGKGSSEVRHLLHVKHANRIDSIIYFLCLIC